MNLKVFSSFLFVFDKICFSREDRIAFCGGLMSDKEGVACELRLLGVVTDRGGLPHLIASLVSEKRGELEVLVFGPCSVDEVPENVREELGLLPPDSKEALDGDDASFFGQDGQDLTGYEGLAIFSVAQEAETGTLYVAVGESDELNGGEGEDVELWVFVMLEDPPAEVVRYIDRMFSDGAAASGGAVIEA
jgi:hypothetical protein